MSTNIYPVIMVGGAGTRLWPQSRRAKPKPLMRLGGGESLFRQTLCRAEALAGGASNVIVVTVSDCAEAIRAEAPELPESNVIVEPMGRDTAACVGLGACVVKSRDPDGIMVIAPADHLITPEDGYLRTLRRAAGRAAGGAMVTIGIRPTRPETGYGYILRGEPIEGGGVPAFKVRSFTEKPDLALARQYVEAGGYYWNGGIFIWRADRLLAEMERNLPGHAAAMERIGAAAGGADFERVLAEQYEGLTRISIDYGVMERARGVEVVEAQFAWDDLGSWTSVAAHLSRDEHGNAVADAERFIGLDVKDCVVVGSGGRTVSALGIEGLVIVETEDAVFICPRARDQEVKRMVEELKDRGLEGLL